MARAPREPEDGPKPQPSRGRGPSAPRRAGGGAGRKPAPPGRDDPEVLFDVELADGCLWLVLANPSGRAAYDVKVEFRGKLVGAGGERDLSRLRLFQGLPLLRPGREIRVFLDVARLLLARRAGRIVDARVAWRAKDGAPFVERFRHDLSVWEDFPEATREAAPAPPPEEGPRT